MKTEIYRREEVVFNLNNFRVRKKLMLKKLEEAKRNLEVDEAILPHLELLNSIPFCFTTSSCSGRIALIDAPLIGPKRESKKVFRWHCEVEYTSVLNVIINYEPQNVLWLKFDSFIIAFSVASLSWAKFFLKLARYINLKDSGIRSINPNAGWVNMDFMSTEKLSVPVKFGNELLVDEQSLVNIIKIANFLFKKNTLKLELLEKVLKKIVHHIKNRAEIPPLAEFDPELSEFRDKLEKLKEKIRS